MPLSRRAWGPFPLPVAYHAGGGINRLAGSGEARAAAETALTPKVVGSIPTSGTPRCTVRVYLSWVEAI